MADTTVSIGADLTELRRELGKLPNLSTDAAQKTLIQVEKAVQKAEKAAKKSAKAVAKANRAASDTGTKALKGLGDTAGDTDSALKAVAGAIGLINPELEKALMGAGDLAGGLEGVTKGTALMGSSFTPMLALLGPFVVVLGAAAAGLYSLYAAQVKSKEASEANKKILDQLKPLTEGLEQARRDLAVATGSLTQAEADLSTGRARFHEQFLKSTEVLRATLKERQADLRRLEEALANVDDQQRSVLAGPGIDPRAEKKKQIIALKAEVARLQERFDDAAASTRALREDTEAAATAQDEATAKTEAAAAAKDRLARESERLSKALAEELERWNAFLSDLDFVLDASRAAGDARRGLNDEIEDSPDDLIPPEWIREMRELSDAVDRLVPKEALSEFDQLTGLLAALSGAWQASGFTDDLLESQIRRVSDRMTELSLAAQEVAVELDPEVVRSFWEKFETGATTAVGAVSGLSGAISGALSMFDRFLQLAGGFSLADLGTVAAEGGDVGAIVEEMIQGGQETIRVFIEHLPEVLAAFVAGLPELIDAFIAAIPSVVRAVADAVPLVIDELVAALPGLVSTVVDLLPGLFDGIIAKLPMIVGAVLDALPTVIDAVLEAVGEIGGALIAQIPDITLAVIDALPSVLAALADALPDLAISLIHAVLTELVPRLPEISMALTEALLIDLPVALAEAFVENIRRFFEDMLTELSPGAQTTETFGDTPGPIRAPLTGLTARFAAGDTVIAAADPQELLRQAHQAAGGQGSGAQVVTLDLRDGHLAFDRMFRTNIRSGGSLSTLNSAPIGRVKVYG